VRQGLRLARHGRRDGTADATLDGSSDASIDTTPIDVHVDDANVDVPIVPRTEPPPIPVGLDAFRLWDRWPYLRIGRRTYMRSTYDRSGGNEAADASHFLRATANDRWVPLDLVGSGELHFFRANHWHGSPWHFLVDGAERIVQETSTADPDHPVAGGTFLPADVFPSPLALTWSTSQGADVSWVPMGFLASMQLAYEHTFYGTGYYIYSLYSDSAKTSRPLSSFDGATAPSSDVIDLITHAGEDQAPTGGSVSVLTQDVTVPAGGSVVAAALDGPQMIRALKITVPPASGDALGAARIRMTWEDRSQPSVDAPLSLFFGAGNLRNHDGREWLVKSFAVSIHLATDATTFASYFPMPFQRKAKIEIVSGGATIDGVHVEVRSVPFVDPANWVGWFHATAHDVATPDAGKDVVLLDTTADESSGATGGAWCGHVVGTSFVFTDRGGFGTLEGDPRFFFDDSKTPQVQGTGSEEWAAGGDYFQGGLQSTLAFAGHPVGAPGSEIATAAPEDKVESEYRFLLSDLMPFGKNARVQIEHGGADDSTEHYSTIAYWYGIPGACLVQTDELHVGDPIDEKAHVYVSPDASDPQTISSRYEWGVDHLGGVEIYPEETDTERHTKKSTEFAIKIDPKNFGVLLRRKLDYSLVDQRADVYVADDVAKPTFNLAGTWYLAGSNTCAFATSGTETGGASPTIETSNRRWRDDEFMIPRALTEGLESIRVRIIYHPIPAPLLPGGAPPDSAWSESHYTAYVWQLPPVP
jgi:hypothetical protein